MRLATAILILSLLGVCAPPGGAATLDKFRLLTFDQPPYIHVDANGLPQGAAVEMVREIFSRMHVAPEMRVYPLARAQALFAHGDAAGIFIMKRNPARQALYAFSDQPLFTQEVVLFVRKDSMIGYTGDLRVLSGRSIGLLRGASYGEVFDAAVAGGMFSRLEYVAQDEWNFRKLMAGRIDAVICGRQAGMAMLAKLGGSASVLVAGRPLELTGSYLMFRKGMVSDDFLRRLNRVMAAMRRDGTAGRIRSKYGVQ
ncbi:transporter substrate-binding domain-containing protein [Duganella sp. FT80W]|uniref:Transporter substrate-binding domain-containing protein n=1 Tax=Duganella guangzhouensis TaxID=2666084 RepID=A0A6I2L5Q9_9BURK|nr:transporter substrate-binding domain-containing protein [Duganella guangzhouensis]MRW91996.1 transporter substrate-binding domain-containing protein [Duganella guangzhouensis]